MTQHARTTPADTDADATAAAAPPSSPVAGNPLLAGYILANSDDPATIGALLFVYSAAVAAMEQLNGVGPDARERAPRPA